MNWDFAKRLDEAGIIQSMPLEFMTEEEGDDNDDSVSTVGTDV